jgi:hypothetical protein
VGDDRRRRRRLSGRRPGHRPGQRRPAGLTVSGRHVFPPSSTSASGSVPGLRLPDRGRASGGRPRRSVPRDGAIGVTLPEKWKSTGCSEKSGTISRENALNFFGPPSRVSRIGYGAKGVAMGRDRRSPSLAVEGAFARTAGWLSLRVGGAMPDRGQGRRGPGPGRWGAWLGSVRTREEVEDRAKGLARRDRSKGVGRCAAVHGGGGG